LFRTAVLGSITALAAWQALILLLSPPAYILPAPLDVLQTLAGRWRFMLPHAGLTLTETVLGLLCGSAAGALTAFLTAALPRLGKLVWPLILVLQALPVFAIAPLLVIWFGFGLVSKIAMTSLIIFFPVASAFADGIARTEPAILDACALTHASRWQTLTLIRLPLALPALVTGLRIAAPLAPLGAVVGEWVGASGGLGFLMIQANARMQTADVFAALTILAALTLLLRALVDQLAGCLPVWARTQSSRTTN
jgi:putative hydroxymethylpyrimidine transport system permease protein